MTRCSVGCERGRTDDGPVGGRTAAGGNAEHGLEGYMAIEAAIVAECELVEIGIEVLVAQTVIGAQAPAFIREKTRGIHGRATWPAMLPTVRRSRRGSAHSRHAPLPVASRRSSRVYV